MGHGTMGQYFAKTDIKMIFGEWRVRRAVSDWRGCLRHLVAAASIDGTPWGRLIEAALNSGDFHDEIDLGVNGMRVAAGASGIVFDNVHHGLARIFAGTPWADGRWTRALRAAPGACAADAEKCGRANCRAVFVPVDVILDAAIAADPR